jgi:hypothetical protein
MSNSPHAEVTRRVGRTIARSERSEQAGRVEGLTLLTVPHEGELAGAQNHATEEVIQGIYSLQMVSCTQGNLLPSSGIVLGLSKLPKSLAGVNQNSLVQMDDKWLDKVPDELLDEVLSGLTAARDLCAGASSPRFSLRRRSGQCDHGLVLSVLCCRRLSAVTGLPTSPPSVACAPRRRRQPLPCLSSLPFRLQLALPAAGSTPWWKTGCGARWWWGACPAWQRCWTHHPRRQTGGLGAAGAAAWRLWWGACPSMPRSSTGS